MLPVHRALGSIPGQGTRSHMPQLRVYMLQLKIQRTATKTQCRQINKHIFKKKTPMREFVVCLRELRLGLWDSLEERDGVGGGRESHEGGDTCILMTDSR